MKFKRWLRNWLYSDNGNMVQEKAIAVNSIGHDIRRGEDSVSFRVYGARGGKIVETSHYDTKTDRSSTTLHIITDEEDFAKAISNIVTLEYLSR